MRHQYSRHCLTWPPSQRTPSERTRQVSRYGWDWSWEKHLLQILFIISHSVVIFICTLSERTLLRAPQLVFSCWHPSAEIDNFVQPCQESSVWSRETSHVRPQTTEHCLHWKLIFSSASTRCLSSLCNKSHFSLIFLVQSIYLTYPTSSFHLQKRYSSVILNSCLPAPLHCQATDWLLSTTIIHQMYNSSQLGK